MKPDFIPILGFALLALPVTVTPSGPKESPVNEKTTQAALMEARYLSVSIKSAPEDVYAFASNPENVPKWATGLSGSIKKSGTGWIAETPLGKAKIRFAEKNPFGVLDHDVIPESGPAVHVPMRVVPNGAGSEVVFTLFRRPGMTDEEFSRDVEWVKKDLGILKALLEK